MNIRNPSLPKQVAALKRAIQSLKNDRRRNFAAGEHAYQHRVRVDRFNKDGIVGQSFGFAEDDHKSYVLLTEYIQQLEDLIEILTDPGVVHEGNSDLPLFKLDN